MSDEIVTEEIPTLEAEAMVREQLTESAPAPAAAEATPAPVTPPAPKLPRVYFMDRPAPINPGFIGIELPASTNGWLLVQLDPSCDECDGTGKVDVNDPDHKPENKDKKVSCGCVREAVGEFLEKVKVKAEEYAAEKRADFADAKLAARVEEARKRVTELEAARDLALGDNRERRTKLETTLTTLRDLSVKWVERSVNLCLEGAEAATQQETKRLAAHAAHEAAVKKANDDLAETLERLAGYYAGLAKCNSTDRAEVEGLLRINEADIAVAEAELARLNDGPLKMERRWEERLKGPRATLARLEARWRR